MNYHEKKLTPRPKKRVFQEKADITIQGKPYTISPANGNVNITGGSMDKEFSVKVSAFINIDVKIVDVVLAGGKLKITADAMGMTKHGLLGQSQVNDIFASVLANKSSFEIAGDDNTFIFTEV